MSASGLRCTDAAVSHWERGKRLPSVRMMQRVLHAFSELGATPTDLDGLRVAWTTERSTRYPDARGHGEKPPDAAVSL
ncbi:MAG TPA: helix-turn-helix transcriptional regulator [Polyangiaceae bacterium]|nr:helix-turn-helix transcriptional regulator [Polyangiaceae bacterium]